MIKNGEVVVSCGDSLNFYEEWPSPTVIVSDGPYGIGGFPGDPKTATNLGKIYEPHIAAWSRQSTRQTTLWFWNTELGWASVHPVLEKYGWKFKSSHVWDKGKGHIAGNVNSKSIRKLPVVTEVCVQYSFEPKLPYRGEDLTMVEWLRAEWRRTGLPMNRTNIACGVKDAATRKYFTLDEHLWYMPPVDAFVKLVEYANDHGNQDEKPFFTVDGKKSLSAQQWEAMRPKFNYVHGHTNVWSLPALRSSERLKIGGKSVHLNQKPLALMRLIIELSSDEGDVVWEPFGGLCSALVAAKELGRRGYGAEISETVYNYATERLEIGQPTLSLSPLS